jgi:2-C-methyl-D-erythritol 4-phosphate cytidylyltransferase
MSAVATWAVVAAAGAGTRLAAGRPKAFAGLGGRPLLARAVELFEEHPAVDGVVLVVPEGWEEPASLLADELAAGKVAAAVAGGAERGLSVAAGLERVPADAGVILVHDAARPFADAALVDRLLAALADAHGAVPGVPVTDTLKRVEGDRVAATVPRADLVAVQTPQAFRADALRRGYAAGADAVAAATDCAALVEATGGRVVVVAGDPANVKITSAADLRRADGSAVA